MPLSSGFYAYSAFIFCFYHITNATIQYLFYHRGRKSPEEWRTQPERPKVEKEGKFVPWIPILEPLLGIRKPGAEPYPNGWLISTVNAVIASLFAGVVAELAVRGFTKLYFDAPALEWGFCLTVAGELLMIVLHESVVEYYWHWLMHVPFFYKRFHKIHHHNKSPMPFDDMLIHPVEAFGYYCILYSPPFIYRVHWVSFFAYMAVMGLFGVIDHCGVKLRIPWVYDSADHDLHHEKFHPNLGFPFVFMDLLHGTRATRGDYKLKLKPGDKSSKAE